MPANKSSHSQKSTLGKKLNITLFFIFCLGMTLSGITFATLISYEAYKQTLSKSLLLLHSLNAVQSYTAKELRPQVQQHLKNKGVLPQIVPSYAANKVFENLRQSDESYNSFSYKYAMLNTNKIQDKADEFERNIIEQFRQTRTVKQLEGFRYINNDYFFYVARPLIIAKSANDHIEIVGTQIVFVPIIKTVQNFGILFARAWGVMAIILLIAILMINFWLRRHIIKSIRKITQVAEAVSTGDMNAEFEKVSDDEIGSLVEAFTRIKMSLAMAIEKFEQYRIKSRNTGNSRKIEPENITPRLRE
ncbi:c-type heme family protein [[Phormidium ambiguum] IAM M-71]|nr:DUF3365 domain-containing protein [Phormidium ambiguum]